MKVDIDQFNYLQIDIAQQSAELVRPWLSSASWYSRHVRSGFIVGQIAQQMGQIRDFFRSGFSAFCLGFVPFGTNFNQFGSIPDIRVVRPVSWIIINVHLIN